MKYVIAVVAMSFLVLTALGQQRPNVVIQPDLEQEIRRAGPNDFIRIIIRMKAQMPAAERGQAVASAKGKESRKALARRLRAFAAQTQRGVRQDLERLQAQGLVRDVKPLWLSNVIAAKVRPDAIKRLAERDDIEYIKQDVERPVFQAPVWSVTQINADDVWTLVPTPYNGDGVVVAVLDTGIDLTHGDLVNRLWINTGEDFDGNGQFTAADNNGVDNDGNGFIDDVVGWDFATTDNDPTDGNGHGTHCAGSVAGDGAGGTATGVAPGAKLMALRYSAQIVAGQAESWQAMEYAMENGADVVSFSSGWRDSWSPDYVTWRQNTDVLTDAGVLFVVAAGNWTDAPPGGVLTPARSPRALAVGSTDNTDAISAFSGIGPSTWQTVAGYDDYLYPPGLLKPDVAAPGEDVNSCVIGGGYGLNSGTSMATPHTSGLAALLLDKNPALLPHELAYIIRETAVDFGAAGPDNTFGHGRINALDAVNLVYSGSGDYDLSVTGTNQVWTTVDIWVDNNDDGTPDDPIRNQVNHLYARVRNLGPRAAGNVEVKFYFADVGTIGIGGFDPNGDGDPADGNFMYIDSFFVPVIGPAGSSQDEVIVAVPWTVPTPTGDHWCVGIGIVAPNPPNANEPVKTNNRAFRNFFNILLALGDVEVFAFDVWPNPRRPREPFDLVFNPRNLPRGMQVELQIDERLAGEWLRNMDGFERVKLPEVKRGLRGGDTPLQQGGRAPAAVRLGGKPARLARITAPEGKPVRVQLVLRAPAAMPKGWKPNQQPDALLVIDTVQGKERVGGLTLDIDLRERGRVKPKLKAGRK